MSNNTKKPTNKSKQQGKQQNLKKFVTQNFNMTKEPNHRQKSSSINTNASHQSQKKINIKESQVRQMKSVQSKDASKNSKQKQTVKGKPLKKQLTKNNTANNSQKSVLFKNGLHAINNSKVASLSTSKFQQKKITKSKIEQKSIEVKNKMTVPSPLSQKGQKIKSSSLSQMMKPKIKQKKIINQQNKQQKVKNKEKQKQKQINQKPQNKKNLKPIQEVQLNKVQKNYLQQPFKFQIDQGKKTSKRTNNLMNQELTVLQKNHFPKQKSKKLKNTNQVIELSSYINDKTIKQISISRHQVQKIEVKLQNSQISNNLNSSKYLDTLSNIQKDMMNFPSYLRMDNSLQMSKWQKNIILLLQILQNDFQKNYTSKCLNILITIFSKSKQVYYSYATDNNKIKKFLISELVKSVVFNYLHIMPINISNAIFITDNWKDVNTKTSLVTLSSKQFQQIGEMIDFAFDELKNKSLFQKHYKPYESFLWQTFISFMEILKYNLCEKQCNYQKQNQILPHVVMTQRSLIFSSLNLVLRFTDYFRKKVFPQIIKQKQHQIKNLFRICASKVINYSYQIQFLKQKCDWINSEQIQKMRLNLKLPLYDWGILSIKSRDFAFFKDIMNSCLQYFTQIYQQSPINNKFVKRQSFQKIKDHKRRTTIMQAPIQLQNSNQWNEQLEPINPIKKQFMQNIETGCQQNQNMQNTHQIPNLKTSNFISPQINCLMLFSNILKMDWCQQINHSNSKKIQLQIKIQQTKVNETIEMKNQIKDFEIFVFIILYKDIIIKLISDIQIVDPLLISQHVCKGMIKLTLRCDFFKYQTNMEKIISQILKHDRYTKILQTCLVNQKKIIHRLSSALRGNNLTQNKNRFSLKDNFFNNESKIDKKRNTDNKNSQNHQSFNENQNQSWRSLIIKSCQNIFYNIQNILQVSMPLLPIQYYETQFAHQPQIFTIEIFFEKLLQSQPIQRITKFMGTLVTIQIKKRKVMLRMTDLMKYFTMYIQFCLKVRQQSEIGVFILGLQHQIFLEFNEIVYIQSIDEKFDKKFHLPEFEKSKNKLALLLSAGAYQKHMLIDRFFPQTSQQLLWRQIFKKMYFIDLQMLYFVPKCFYGTIYYELLLNKYQKVTAERLEIFITNFSDSIDKGKLSSVCSTFHLIMIAFQITQKNICPQIQPILHNRKSTNCRQSLGKTQSKDQKYQIMIQSVFFLIMQKHKKILDLFKETQENQLKCIKNFSLTQQQNRNIMKGLEQYKKMHIFLLQNIVRFFQIVQISPRFSQKLRHPQTYMEIISMFYKNTGIFYFKTLQRLSKVVSNQVYHNLVQEKIKNQQSLKNTSDLHLLKNLTLNWITQRNLFQQKSKKSNFAKRSRSKRIKNQDEQSQQINLNEIFDLCLETLQKSITGTSERQILRCKVIALQILKIVQEFLFQNIIENQLIHLYNKKYSERLRKVLLQLLLREKTLISKYQKQLFINIRLFILFWMIQNFSKVIRLQDNKTISFEFLPQKQFWHLLYTLSFDQMIEIRISLLNACLSRFKTKQFKMFQMKKSRIWVIFMIMSIYQPESKLKQLCQLIISSVKNQCQDVEDLLQSIILCLNFSINFNYQQLIKTKSKKLNQNYFSQILSQIFIDRKEVEYGLFSILTNLINEQKYGFERIKLTHKNQLAFYYLAAGGDFLHPKKQYFDLMDQLKNCDTIPLNALQDKLKKDQKVFPQNEALFEKLQKETLISMVQRIKQNGKTGRIIKSKKDIIINWSQMKNCNIIRRKH